MNFSETANKYYCTREHEQCRSRDIDVSGRTMVSWDSDSIVQQKWCYNNNIVGVDIRRPNLVRCFVLFIWDKMFYQFLCGRPTIFDINLYYTAVN